MTTQAAYLCSVDRPTSAIAIVLIIATADREPLGSTRPKILRGRRRPFANWQIDRLHLAHRACRSPQ